MRIARSASFRFAAAVAAALLSAPVLPAAVGPVLAGAAAAPDARAARESRGMPRGASAITAAQLRDYLTFIASDELEGRQTPSRGLDTAARFLALQLSRAGLEPAGDDGSYFQTIGLTTRRVEPARTTVALGEKTFAYGDDFLAGSTPGTVEGPLVYVGHGYVVKEKNLDAYRGIDVAGKILVSHAGLPPGVSRQDVRGAPGERWDSALTYGARHGARGVIVVPDFRTLAGWSASRQRAVERGDTTMDARMAAEGGRGAPAPLPTITASPAMLQALFADEKLSAGEIFRRAQTNDAAEAFALSPTKQARFTVEISAQPSTTRNVVAIVRGSDPKLKDEYVALGAHYDHVGVGTGTGDIIYNGADDDGSGTTALLAIAEGLARLEPRPKRSVLFVWHAGEEHGLWGSAYFTAHPTVPLDRLIAQLNIDMIGRSRAPGDTSGRNAKLTGPDEVYVIGSKMMSSALGELSERVNASFLKLAFNYVYDDPKAPDRLFFRSDHYNYARKGVPIIFYFSGLHEDYHRPSDSVEKIDFAKLEKVTRTVYATALALAETPERPRVDRKLAQELSQE